MPTSDDDDLRATIARLRHRLNCGARNDLNTIAVNANDICCILDAAEATRTMFTVEETGQLQTDARNAALEEAIGTIEDSRGEIEDDDDGRSAAVDEHCTFLVDTIHALKKLTDADK